MVEQLIEQVYNANLELMDLAPCQFPWVSISAADHRSGRAVFAPYGGAVSPRDMIVTDFEGNPVSGRDAVVPDAPVHLSLYRAWPEVNAIARPYSRWATVFAQLGLSVPTLGTVHAAVFGGDIPATDLLPAQVLADPGHPEIARAILNACPDPDRIPAALVTCHGAYTFGGTPAEAVSNVLALDEICCLAYHTLQLDPGIRPMQFSFSGKALR